MLWHANVDTASEIQLEVDAASEAFLPIQSSLEVQSRRSVPRALLPGRIVFTPEPMETHHILLRLRVGCGVANALGGPRHGRAHAAPTRKISRVTYRRAFIAGLGL